MEQDTFDFGAEAPVKLCECGCGQPAPLAQVNNKQAGLVKGQPRRFVYGHQHRQPGWQDRLRESQPDAEEHGLNANTKMFVRAGQRFGHGVVIDPDARIKFASIPGPGRRAARLLCDCGNEYVRALHSLVGKGTGTAQSLSCGCMGRGRTIDKMGQRFGKLVVIKFAGIRPPANKHQGGATWLCKCDCGNEITVSTANLNRTKSCGCSRRQPRNGRTPESVAREKALKAYMRGAQQRDLPWELTDDEFFRMAAMECHYCGGTPSLVQWSGTYKDVGFVYNGIDRIDPKLGYTSQNTLPCCSLCNMAKRDMPYDVFLGWIARLTEYHFFHPDILPSAMLRAAGQKPALRVVRADTA